MYKVIITMQSGEEKTFDFLNDVVAFEFADKWNTGDKMDDGNIVKSIKVKGLLK